MRMVIQTLPINRIKVLNPRSSIIGKHISMNQPKHIAYAFQTSLKNIALKDIQTMHPSPKGYGRA